MTTYTKCEAPSIFKDPTEHGSGYTPDMQTYNIETFINTIEAAITCASKRNLEGVEANVKEAEVQRQALIRQATVRFEPSFISQVQGLWEEAVRSVPLAWEHEVAAFFEKEA